MKKMIGYCGYNCHLCAARSEDLKTRQKLVDGWKRIFGHQHYTAEKDSAVTEEEYDLCMRQFDSMGNIVEQLIEAGKLPSWARKE